MLRGRLLYTTIMGENSTTGRGSCDRFCYGRVNMSSVYADDLLAQEKYNNFIYATWRSWRDLDDFDRDFVVSLLTNSEQVNRILTTLLMNMSGLTIRRVSSLTLPDFLYSFNHVYNNTNHFFPILNVKGCDSHKTNFLFIITRVHKSFGIFLRLVSCFA